MPGSSKRAMNIARARDLYARGVSAKEIAELLGVRRSTIHNWSAYDRKRGISWNEMRERMGDPSPYDTLRTLRERMAQMVAEGGRTGPADLAERRQHEKRLLEMTRVLKGCEKTADELTRQLLALEEFAEYCAQNLTREELAVVRRAIEGFTARLQRENG